MLGLQVHGHILSAAIDQRRRGPDNCLLGGRRSLFQVPVKELKHYFRDLVIGPAEVCVDLVVGGLDVRPFLKGDGAMNELIVRVGASPVPRGAAIVASLAAGDQPRALTTSSDQTARCPSSNRSSLVSTRANPFGAGRDHGPRHRQWPTVNTTAASSAAFSW
jgi:hypothetical protein